MDIGKSSAEIFQVVTLIGSESLFLSGGELLFSCIYRMYHFKQTL